MTQARSIPLTEDELEQLEELHQLVAASCADAQEALRALEAGGVADAKAILSRLLGRPVPATTV
jgi:Na+/phosphate symporter